MDLGLVGIESFVGLDSEQPQQQEARVDEATAEAKKSNDNGSGSVKQQERSGPIEENHRAFKVGRLSSTDDIGFSSKTMHIHQGTPLLRSNPSASDNGGGGGRSQPRMLSFASPISEISLSSKDDVGGGSGLGDNRNTQNLNLSFYHPNVSNSTYTRDAEAAGAGVVYGCGNLNGSLQGSFTGIRGPFTPAQWIELEQQALIYKYLTAGVPVPASLLVPIRKALNSTGFSGFNAGSFLSHPYGWGGSFHLGFSGSSDPEPGRCRRTDGKKWRCSRDAVPDQKYCERHINRGRHRSRKPVENQTGQAAASGGPNTCATATNDNNRIVKVAAVPPSSVVSMPSTSSSGADGGFTSIHQHQQMKSLQQPGPGINIPPADQIVGRFQDSRDLSMMPMPPSIDLKSKDSPFSILKEHNMPFMESSDFGFVSTDSLLNPSLQKTSSSSYTNAKSFTNSFLNFTEDRQTEDQHSIRQFMDDWPKDGHSNRSSMVWPEELKSDWTQLSMSIPVSNLTSSSSPNPDKIGLSPVRLSREVLDPTQMALGVGCNMYENEPSPKSGNWMLPVSRGRNSMGGPLGEVLNNASNGSPQLGSSPTGVLQKATFVSLSNSSSGSSPRGENKKTQEGGGGLCDNLLGTAHASSSSIPAL